MKNQNLENSVGGIVAPDAQSARLAKERQEAQTANSLMRDYEVFMAVLGICAGVAVFAMNQIYSAEYSPRESPAITQPAYSNTNYQVEASN